MSQLRRAAKLKAELAEATDAEPSTTVDGVIATLMGYDATTSRDDLRVTRSC